MSSDDPSMPAIVPAVVVPAVIDGPNIVAATAIDAANSQQPTQVANRYEPEGYSQIATNCWLFGSLAILVLAAVMSVGSERRVFLPGIAAPFPELCTLRSRFNIDCPGCGMTRGFIHFAHGRVLDGMRMNPASLLVFLFVAAQIPAAAARYAFGRSSQFAVAWARWNEVALIVLPSLAFIQWIIRMSIGVYT